MNTPFSIRGENVAKRRVRLAARTTDFPSVNAGSSPARVTMWNLIHSLLLQFRWYRRRHPGVWYHLRIYSTVVDRPIYFWTQEHPETMRDLLEEEKYDIKGTLLYHWVR